MFSVFGNAISQVMSFQYYYIVPVIVIMIIIFAQTVYRRIRLRRAQNTPSQPRVFVTSTSNFNSQGPNSNTFTSPEANNQRSFFTKSSNFPNAGADPTAPPPAYSTINEENYRTNFTSNVNYSSNFTYTQ